MIFMLMGLMLFTGVTPADIWYFFSGHAGRMKDSMDRRADARAQLREARAWEAEQARLRLRKKRGGIRCPPGTMSRPSTWMQRPTKPRAADANAVRPLISTLAARLSAVLN
ncbi:MAG: hypothetical protein ACLR7U_00530 [Ruthenibacterium lactatiformans]